MDIHVPMTDHSDYPVVVMFHGGGWLINDKTIMSAAADYLARHGKYIVCNVNYRLLGDLENSVTMDEIVSDAFGALLWVKENIAHYGGDPARVIVTGDSAGGHLATMLATQGHRLNEAGFVAPDYGFRPSYLPAAGIDAADVTVAAAIISYGAFDHVRSAVSGFETANNIFWQLGGAEPRGIFGADRTLLTDRERYVAVSPALTVEPATQKDYPPMLFTVGSEDDLTTPELISEYVASLRKAGHDNLDYWVHEGRPHAFLDAGVNPWLGIEFNRDAIPALDYMLGWLDDRFYQE